MIIVVMGYESHGWVTIYDCPSLSKALMQVITAGGRSLSIMYTMKLMCVLAGVGSTTTSSSGREASTASQNHSPGGDIVVRLHEVLYCLTVLWVSQGHDPRRQAHRLAVWYAGSPKRGSCCAEFVIVLWPSSSLQITNRCFRCITLPVESAS